MTILHDARWAVENTPELPEGYRWVVEKANANTVTKEIGTLSDGRPVVGGTDPSWRAGDDYFGRMLVLDNAHLPRLFKILTGDGRAANGGNMTWPLPTPEGPGEWVDESSEPIQACRRGLHFTPADHIAGWAPYYSNPRVRVFEAEIDGPVIVHSANKVVAARARLLREVDINIDLLRNEPRIHPADQIRQKLRAERLEEIQQELLSRAVERAFSDRRYWHQPTVQRLREIVNVNDNTRASQMGVKYQLLQEMVTNLNRVARYAQTVSRAAEALGIPGAIPLKDEERMRITRTANKLRDFVGTVRDPQFNIPSQLMWSLPEADRKELEARITVDEDHVTRQAAESQAQHDAWQAQVDAMLGTTPAPAPRGRRGQR